MRDWRGGRRSSACVGMTLNFLNTGSKMKVGGNFENLEMDMFNIFDFWDRAVELHPSCRKR